jgi:hypothetical protein
MMGMHVWTGFIGHRVQESDGVNTVMNTNGGEEFFYV